MYYLIHFAAKNNYNIYECEPDLNNLKPFLGDMLGPMRCASCPPLLVCHLGISCLDDKLL